MAMESRWRNRNRALGGGWLAVALALACGREGGEARPEAAAVRGDSPVVARLNGDPLTIADLQGGLPRGMRQDPDHALEAALTRRLAAQEARRRGLADSSEVRAQVDALRLEAAAREEALLRDALYAALQSELVLSDVELRAHYERTQARYTERRLRLRRAAFPSAEAARAEDARLGSDGHLDPASSEEIGPAPIAKLMQGMLPGVMRLREPGQRIVVERAGDFALVELVEVLPPAPLPFEEVREQIENEVRAQRAGEAFAKLVEELRAGARIEIDQAALRDESAWKALPEAQPLRQPWR
jgi:hypothetical protein